MATSGGIEFNDDDIDPELDLDSKGDLEGSFDDLPPEALDFDVDEFERELEPEKTVELTDEQLEEITKEITTKVINTLEIDNLVEAPDDVETVKDVSGLSKMDKTLEKAVNKEFNKLNKEARKEVAETKKELAKQHRREIQDEKREIRREKRGLTTDATRRRTDINSDATSAKIATYSLAAAAGLPGYVVASIVNRSIIEPAVDKDIEAERAYSNELINYYNEQEDDIIQKQRDYEDERDSLSVPEFNKDDVQKYLQSRGKRPNTSPINKPTTTHSSFPSGIGQGTPATGGGTPNQPPTNPPTGGTGNTGIPGGSAGLPNTPTRGFNPSSVVNAAGIVTGVIEGAKFVDQQIVKIGQAAKDDIKDFFNESPIDYMAGKVNRTTELLDPLGTRFDLELFNQATQLFATSVSEFDKYSRKDIAFSPETLDVTVEGSINKLLKNIEIAERLDPQKAAMRESMNQIDIIWSEFKAEFFSLFAPAITKSLEVIAGLLSGIRNLIELIHTFLIALDTVLKSRFAIYATLMNLLVKNTAKNNQNKINGLAKELEEFHNPNNQPIPVNSVINRR